VFQLLALKSGTAARKVCTGESNAACRFYCTIEDTCQDASSQNQFPRKSVRVMCTTDIDSPGNAAPYLCAARNVCNTYGAGFDSCAGKEKENVLGKHAVYMYMNAK
jgi:hypothetical protein